MSKVGRHTIKSFLFESTDIAILVYFRIAFGALTLVEVFRIYLNGWIDSQYIDPSFHFSYYGFDWIRPWPDDGMYLHFIGLSILSICIIIGFKYRISTILFVLGFAYVFLLDKALYSDPHYLIILIGFIMIFVPANRNFSIDVKLKPELSTTLVSAWPLWLLRIQIGIVYFYAGLAKINTDWFQGEPLRLYFTQYRADVPLFGSFLTQEWTIYLISYTGFLIDLLAVPLLLFRKTRLPLFCILIGFHVFSYFMFDAELLSPFMIFATLIFFPSNWPRRLKIFLRTKKYLGNVGCFIQLTKPMTPRMNRKQQVGLILMIIFIVGQISVPLRHHVYPGNDSWTEEGYNFSWSMMKRVKITTELEFYAINPITNKTLYFYPQELPLHQFWIMSYQPDLILQYSHYKANELLRSGNEEVEIKAKVMTSLNGRDPQLLIDPNVNLVEQERNMLPAKWIMPLI